MIGVVILHYNNASMGGALGMVLDGSPNQYYLYLIESLFVCAVNVFVMISAYFLACNQNRKLIKILELFVQVIVFNLVFYVFGVLFTLSSTSLTVSRSVSVFNAGRRRISTQSFFSGYIIFFIHVFFYKFTNLA